MTVNMISMLQLFEEDLSVQDSEALATRLKVLADPARLRLLSVLYGCEDLEACVCDLTDPIGLSQPTVSHHLKVLHDAGYVTREQRGQWVYYRLEPEAIETVRAALAVS